MAVPGKKTQTLLSSTTTKGSDEYIKLLCQPCYKEGSRHPAYGYCMDCKEHLCENCFKYHKKATPCRNHRLLDNDSMPQLQQHSETQAQDDKFDNLTQPCQKHKREMIKFYCHDHEALLCTICVTLKHTTCHVNYIPDISGKTVNSKEVQNALKTINNIVENCQKLEAGLKKMIENSNNSLVDALAEIRAFRKAINQSIDKLEKDAEVAAKSLQQKNDRELTNRYTEITCDDVIQSLNTSSDSLKHLNSSEQADKLFMELKNAEKLIKDYEHRISLFQTPGNVKEYVFKQNQAISTLLDTEQSLGTLETKASRVSSTPTADTVKPRQASVQDEISVYVAKDESDWIAGLEVISPDCLILTDTINKSIKMVDTCNNLVTTHLLLQTVPWDICEVGRNKLAVTLPFKQTIQYISASPHKLTQTHTLKVYGDCYGMSCYKEKLVVASDTPAMVQILNMNGKILTTVKTNKDGEDIFCGPRHVVSNSSSIYVSDVVMGTVYRLNWQGETTGMYKNITNPRGMALSDDGSVFVCDALENQVVEISGDCSKGEVVLKVQEPLAVSWCGQKQKLYINSTDYGKSGVLHVFKLS